MNSSDKTISHFVKPFLLPFLAAVYPAFFHYGNNSRLLLIQSLIRVIVFYSLVAAVIYVVFYISGKRAIEAANASFVFLIFFHTYGIVYDYSLRLDIFQVEHYTLLPFYTLLALQFSWWILNISPSLSISAWKNLSFMVGALIIFNAIKIIPVEINKLEKSDVVLPSAATANLETQDYPDIYFIVFDEFSGFEPMRKYWHNPKVDDFAQFLDSHDFFVAEQSHGSSIYTLHQIATRLNYQEFPCCEYGEYLEMFYENVSYNEVMSYLKSRGYSIAVFEELTIPRAYPAMDPIVADYSFADVPETSMAMTNSEILFDEFGMFVANGSMLRTIPTTHDKTLSGHRDKVLYLINKIGDLDQVSSPKFIYVHLLLPHFPFMFDENGNVLDEELHGNWNYYLGQYNYSMEVAKKMIDNILENADPERPPVIIFQSDHGARNIDYGGPLLENFPEEYKTHILFTLRMPGYDLSTLPQDIDPINTFPIVFNYLFDDNIPLK